MHILCLRCSFWSSDISPLIAGHRAYPGTSFLVFQRRSTRPKWGSCGYQVSAKDCLVFDAHSRAFAELCRQHVIALTFECTSSVAQRRVLSLNATKKRTAVLFHCLPCPAMPEFHPFSIPCHRQLLLQRGLSFQLLQKFQPEFAQYSYLRKSPLHAGEHTNQTLS